jgi:hypothetical protein
MCWDLNSGEVRYVYERRKKHNEGLVPTVPLVSSSPLSLSTSIPETSALSSDSEYTSDMIHLPSPPPSLMSLRRTSRSNARIPLDRYDFSHDIAQFVSYSSISHTHGAFIVSLNSVILPKCWQDAKKDSKWKIAILEELGALDKNKTWEFVSLSPGKKAVGCK